MKALVNRLEWVQLYLTGGLGDNPSGKQIALDELNGAIAIAEALPEIQMPDQPTGGRQPPERIIEL